MADTIKNDFIKRSDALLAVFDLKEKDDYSFIRNGIPYQSVKEALLKIPPAAVVPLDYCTECREATNDAIDKMRKSYSGKFKDFQRRGKWIEKPSYTEDKEMGFDTQIVCSICGEQNSHFVFNEYHEPIEKMFIRSNFCPNCGADMRGGT